MKPKIIQLPAKLAPFISREQAREAIGSAASELHNRKISSLKKVDLLVGQEGKPAKHHITFSFLRDALNPPKVNDVSISIIKKDKLEELTSEDYKGHLLTYEFPASEAKEETEEGSDDQEEEAEDK